MKRGFVVKGLVGLAALAAASGLAVATDSFALVSTYYATVQYVGLDGNGVAGPVLNVNSPTHNLSQGSYGIGIGDFDNDGIDDYLIGGNASTYYSAPTTIEFHRGLSADGSSYAPGVTLAGVGGWTYYVMDFAVADYDHDGNLDFEVNDYEGQRVYVYLGNGDGTFRSASSYAIPFHALGADAADLNNDGNVDFAVSREWDNTYCYWYVYGGYYYSSNGASCDPSSTIKKAAVFLGDGHGHFTESVQEFHLPVTTHANDSYYYYIYSIDETWGISLADFDGDGNVDMVQDVMQPLLHGGGQLAVFRGNGDGTFQATAILSAPANSTNYGFAALDNEDINHDGIQDLVWAGENINEVRTYLGNGDGTFSLASKVTANWMTGTSTRPGDAASDRRPPTATIDTQSHLTNIPSLTVTGTVSDSGGIAKVELVRATETGPEVIATATPATNGVVSASITLIEGDNKLHWRATDRAGNTGDSTEVTVTLDSTKPLVVFGTIPAYATDTSFTFVGTASDERKLARVDAKVNGTTVGTTQADSSGAVQFTVTLTPGRNQLTLVAVDEAGNCSTVDSSIIFDSAGPDLTLAALPAFTNQVGHTLTGTVHDEEGVDHLELLVNSARVGGDIHADADGTFHVDIALAEGDNAITIRAYDVAGLATPASTATVLDTVPPTAVIAPLPKYTNVAALQVGGTAADERSGIASITLHVDGGAEATDLAVASDGTLRGTLPLTEGPQRIVLVVTDRAGNIGATSADLTLDTIAPQIAIASPRDGQPFAQTTVPVSAGIIDATPTTVAFGSLQFLIDGTGLASGEVDLGAEGPGSIVVSAVDAAGNQASAHVAVMIDLTAPVGDLDLGVPDGASIGKQANDVLLYTLHVDDLTDVTMTSSWGDAHLFAAADGGGVLQGIAPLREGRNTFVVTLTDAVGHQTVVTRTVTYDTTPPTAAFTGLLATAGSPARGTVELSADATDNLTGVVGATFEVEGAQTAATATGGSFAAAIDTTSLADGLHTVHATFTDGVGNASTLESAVLVDNTAPTVAVTAPAADAWVRQSITLTATASDATSGVANIELAVNGTRVGGCNASPCSVAFDTTALANGPFLVTATAYDRAGNRAAADRTAKADNVAPSKFLVSPLDGATLAGTATVTVNVIDDAFDHVECFVDGVSLGVSTNPQFSATIDLLAKLDGAVVVSCSARDLAGNVGTETATIRVKNWSLVLDPRTLNVKSQGNDVQLTIAGPNVALLLPVTDKALSLVVPGGSPAPLVAKRDGYQVETDGGQPVLKLKFDRKALVASLNAGIAAGAIDASKLVTVRFLSATRELGTDQIRVQGAK